MDTERKPIRLDEHISVAGQIGPDDVPALPGFAMIVNNRPDGEADGQPTGSEIARAALDAGIGYAAIPVGQGGFGTAEIDAMADVMTRARGPILAFCRSGTRSTMLWALASAKLGREPGQLTAKAAAAGYDIRPLAPALAELLQRR